MMIQIKKFRTGFLCELYYAVKLLLSNKFYLKIVLYLYSEYHYLTLFRWLPWLPCL